MSRAAMLAALGLGAGFLVGLAWGQSTRSRIGDNVRASVNSGVVTVTVDAKGAALEGLRDLINL